MNRPRFAASNQTGSTLIEVLVAVLILSFGLLALGGFMTYSVQLPKLSANRSVAVTAANELTERMRGNVTGSTGYVTSTFTTTFTATPTSIAAGSTCSFPNCTTATMATMDIATIDFQVKQQLPNGGVIVTIPDATIPTKGNIWIIWQEPSNFGTFDAGTSDNCPSTITALSLSPSPRCVYAPFSL